MIGRTFLTFTMVTLLVGVSATFVVDSATAATAGGAAPTLRAQVDSIGARYLAAQEQSRALDAELSALDQRLTRTRRREAALRPAMRARAVQLYQSSSHGFTALFDTASAMESARGAELIARAADHTQALLDQYANAAATLERQRMQVARARARQAALMAAFAKQQVQLEHALAQAQQAYRDGLAARAQARALQAAQNAAARSTTQVRAAPTASPPATAPPAPVPVAPPSPPNSGVNPHHNDPFLVCTRTRESAGVYTAVNPGGYYGAYQFGQPTWDLTANHAGSPQLIGVRPDQASPWDQDQLAWVLYQWRGNAPWGGLC